MRYLAHEHPPLGAVRTTEAQSRRGTPAIARRFVCRRRGRLAGRCAKTRARCRPIPACNGKRIPMRAIIAGAGPAGFACAKWLADRGYEVLLLEKRDVPGGKVSAWRDADGDWVESGLHVFFGAYHNLLNFLDECGLGDSFDWKPAEMVFVSPEHGLAPIRFVQGLPAPLNGLAGVAVSPLLPTRDKLRVALGLLWPIFGSQNYIDRQDDQTYAAWHLRHGMGQRSLDDVMHTMALA